MTVKDLPWIDATVRNIRAIDKMRQEDAYHGHLQVVVSAVCVARILWKRCGALTLRKDLRVLNFTFASHVCGR